MEIEIYLRIQLITSEILSTPQHYCLIFKDSLTFNIVYINCNINRYIDLHPNVEIQTNNFHYVLKKFTVRYVKL